MAIEYLVYADAPLDIEKIEQVALATGLFERAEPYRDFTCLNAFGVAIQLRLDDSEKFSISCDGQSYDFSCKTVAFFRLSKNDFDAGRVNMIHFLRILLDYKTPKIILLNNEENDTPYLLSIDGQCHLNNKEFWQENITAILEQISPKFSKLNIVY
jgi:hypothetical protein